ncbi:hypothetical protein TIFTF001_011236 [Ficus carica]|uniref:Uncharacterized protein n=1 Tax=Ficus carica TaxID=3494 RepID=A0AA88ADP7_FICCA|nr:hypothetical protein TIFTF001_011236 [Ficus carica]
MIDNFLHCQESHLVRCVSLFSLTSTSPRSRRTCLVGRRLVGPYIPPLVGLISSSKTGCVPELSIEKSKSADGVLPPPIVTDPNAKAPAA